MSANTYLQDALIRHQVYLQRYAGGVNKELSELITRLGGEVEQAVNRRPYDEGYSGLWIRQVRADLNRIASEIDISGVIEGSLEPLAAQEAAYMERLLDSTTVVEIARTSPERIYALVSAEPLLLHATTGAITRATMAELVNRFTAKVPRDVLNRVQYGIVTGESVRDIARDVNRLVTTRHRRQAEALVRTLVNHVGDQSRQFAAHANAHLLPVKRWLSTLDRRTTLICYRLDGELFRIGEGPRPPIHWNCRSILVPEVHERYGLSGLVGTRPAKGDDGVLQVRGDTRAAAWLRRQSAEFQDDVLGPTRGKLFRSGRYSMDNFVDYSGKIFTLSELREAA